MITFDSKLLETFINQERAFFEGARINKIQQPSRRELLLTIRNGGKSRQLYINIYPQFYHVCFSSEKNIERKMIEIPQKPPMFCMLLRKYLSNSRIAKINQPSEERILELFFETYNELGDKIYLCLAIELMGKYSNIILYNTDTDIILGCAHNVGAEKSSVREVYGQIPYIYPPKSSGIPSDRYKFLINIPSNINSIIDNYYTYHIEKEKFYLLKNKFLISTNKKLKKVEKALSQLEYQSEKNKNSDKYRLWGDLLMANLYNLNDYSDSAIVFDYENNKEISIKLDNKKTLKENANNFYKKYNKSKNEKIFELIEDYSQQKSYFEDLLYSIKLAEKINDLSVLSDEVESDKPVKKYDKRMIEPFKIEKENETRIYIGKNNKQNDYIISKLADEDDLWFHVHNCAGSHVLLKTQKLTDELILECAKLAKKYSSASNSAKAGVIYTKRKYLRKPPKANLGYVTYRNEKEIIVD